jgi:aminoglycoside phosphotransferase (APT) family kinase protein
MTDSAVAPPGVDGAKLRVYLADALNGYDPAGKLTITPLSGGRSNLTYLLAQNGRHWVLRRPPRGHVMPSAHDMAREFRTLTLLSGYGFPVPEPLLLCDDESVLGVPFQVVEYVPGLIVADEAVAGRLTEADAQHLSRELVHTLARLHQIPPPAMAANRSASSAYYLSRQLARWTQQWQHTKTRDLASFTLLARWLQDAVRDVPADDQCTVVHGDYRLDNLVFDPGSKDIRAVLDWEMSTLGDPLMDLAIPLVYWEQPGDVLRRQVAVARGLTTGRGFWSRDELAAEYAEVSGTRMEHKHLDTCIALACFKLAVIMESVHYRYLAGQAMDELSAGLEEAAPALLQMGLMVAEGMGIRGLGI